MAEQIIMKTCRVCKQTKPISEFPKRTDSPDGYRTECTICHYKKQVEYRRYRMTDKTKIKIRKYLTKWRKTPKGRKSVKRALRKHRKTEKYRIRQKRYQEGEKYKATCKRYRNSEAGRITQEKHRKANLAQYVAQAAVFRAVKSGKLAQPNTLKCSCGKQAEQYHHHKGYAPEHHLDVIPVCFSCHGETRKIS